MESDNELNVVKLGQKPPDSMWLLLSLSYTKCNLWVKFRERFVARFYRQDREDNSERAPKP